ncbi:MAG: hypothetical protein ACTHKB_11510 [Burkholderiaceae bacterium]
MKSRIRTYESNLAQYRIMLILSALDGAAEPMDYREIGAAANLARPSVIGYIRHMTDECRVIRVAHHRQLDVHHWTRRYDTRTDLADAPKPRRKTRRQIEKARYWKMKADPVAEHLYKSKRKARKTGFVSRIHIMEG